MDGAERHDPARGTVRWEYTSIQRNSSNLGQFTDDLNALGAQGWEMVGFASADKTLGLNSIMAVLKRPWDGASRRSRVDEPGAVARVPPEIDPFQPTGDDCAQEGCSQPALGGGLCALHAMREGN